MNCFCYYKVERRNDNMLEQLRMQEVSQIIFTMPKGAIIPGKNYHVGEPVMIIDNPSLSTLSFLSRPVAAEDNQGHIGTAGITKNLEFIINDGAVLYSLWSYVYGYDNGEPEGDTYLRGNEYITLSNDGYLWLKQEPKNLYLYEVHDNGNILIPGNTYEVHQVDGDKTNEYKYGIYYDKATPDLTYMVFYEYQVKPVTVSNVKQIHNNIFCAMDVYIDAVDLKNDDKHTVYIHCDKVQITTDLVLSINDSNKASFTPIKVTSIPDGDGFNKDVATIAVI